VKEGKFISSPCKCKNHTQFIHVKCLEILGNTENTCHCPHCHAQHLSHTILKIKHKSVFQVSHERSEITSIKFAENNRMSIKI